RPGGMDDRRELRVVVIEDVRADAVDQRRVQDVEAVLSPPDAGLRRPGEGGQRPAPAIHPLGGPASPGAAAGNDDRSRRLRHRPAPVFAPAGPPPGPAAPANSASRRVTPSPAAVDSFESAATDCSVGIAPAATAERTGPARPAAFRKPRRGKAGSCMTDRGTH